MDGVRVRDKLSPRDGLKVSYFCFTNYLEMKNSGFPVCHQNALLHPAVTSIYIWLPRALFEIPVCHRNRFLRLERLFKKFNYRFDGLLYLVLVG